MNASTIIKKSLLTYELYAQRNFSHAIHFYSKHLYSEMNASKIIKKRSMTYKPYAAYQRQFSHAIHFYIKHLYSALNVSTIIQKPLIYYKQFSVAEIVLSSYTFLQQAPTYMVLLMSLQTLILLLMIWKPYAALQRQFSSAINFCSKHLYSDMNASTII